MDVTNYNAAGVATTTTNVAWPANGVLYVENNGSCDGRVSDRGQVHRAGHAAATSTSAAPTRKSLTIAAANDVIVRPTLGGKLNSVQRRQPRRESGTDAMLGLIANNFVRVATSVNRARRHLRRQLRLDQRADGRQRADRRGDPVAAALLHRRQLRLRHALGTLTVNGAIVQKYRGPVGTGTGGTIVDAAT